MEINTNPQSYIVRMAVLMVCVSPRSNVKKTVTAEITTLASFLPARNVRMVTWSVYFRSAMLANVSHKIVYIAATVQLIISARM